MKTNFESLQAKTDIIVKNASPCVAEYVISEVFKARKETVVFITHTLKPQRIAKNLAFFLPNVKVLMPEPATGIYDFALTEPSGTAAKIKGLKELFEHSAGGGEPAVIVLDYRLLLPKLQPIEYFMDEVKLKIRTKFAYQALISRLCEFGFTRTEVVYEFGEFAVRGFIIDIGLLGGFFRVEFDGDEILQIHQFSTETQRKTGEEVREIGFSRIKDVEVSEESTARFKQQLYKLDLPAEEVTKAMQFLHEGVASGVGLGSYIPLFFGSCSGVLDFLPMGKCSFIYEENLPLTLKFFMQNLEKKWEAYKAEGRFILPPEVLTSKPEEVLPKLTPCVQLSAFGLAPEA